MVKDMLGMTLEDAQSYLKEQGIIFEIKTAAPFFKGEPLPPAEGAVRIIKQKEENGVLKLTACLIPEGKING